MPYEVEHGDTFVREIVEDEVDFARCHAGDDCDRTNTDQDISPDYLLAHARSHPLLVQLDRYRGLKVAYRAVAQ